MNIERLTVIAEWLEDGAPHVNNCGFNMNNWLTQESGLDYSHNECGTAMCIGGAAQQWWGSPEKVHISIEDEVQYSKDILGLDYDTAYNLFYPKDIDDYDKITAFEAAITIRHLIKTGRVSWDHVEYSY